MVARLVLQMVGLSAVMSVETMDSSVAALKVELMVAALAAYSDVG